MLEHCDIIEATTPTPFVQPPMDNRLPFPHWVDFHLKHNPTLPYSVVSGYADASTEITWGEFARAVLRFSVKLREQVKIPREQQKHGVKVAIFVNTDMLAYCTMLLGIMRAGFLAIPITTRNPKALLYILTMTSPEYLLMSTPVAEASFAGLKTTSVELLSNNGTIVLLPVPGYTDLYPRLGRLSSSQYKPAADADNTPDPSELADLGEHVTNAADVPLFILHSSSDNYPKLLPISHQFWLTLCRFVGKEEHTSARWGTLAMPALHTTRLWDLVAKPFASGNVPRMHRHANRGEIQLDSGIQWSTLEATGSLPSNFSVARDLASQYSQKFPIHQPGRRSVSGEVVLLTGSTGALGTYLLHQLLIDGRIERVYALNRRSAKGELFARQTAAHVDRGLDADELKLPKLRLLEGDLSAERLGLDPQTYEEMLGSVTTIIHNAWLLHFTLPVSAFSTHVLALRRLIDLALTTRGPHPAKVVFPSSTTAVWRSTSKYPVPELPIDDPSVVGESGYSQSKWVAERLLIAAAQKTDLRATVWRVGQLCGSTHNGAWNTTGWVPLLVKGGERLRMLPTLARSVNWIALDTAAQVIVDGMFSLPSTPEISGSRVEYLNLVHPSPVAWDDIFKCIAERIGCQMVPAGTWLQALEKDEVARNPLMKLIDFFGRVLAGRIDSEMDANEGEERMGDILGGLVLETSKAQQRSQTLRELGRLGEDDVTQWLTYWKTHGLFPQRDARL